MSLSKGKETKSQTVGGRIKVKADLTVKKPDKNKEGKK
jgi:hypothetical protein